MHFLQNNNNKNAAIVKKHTVLNFIVNVFLVENIANHAIVLIVGIIKKMIQKDLLLLKVY